MINGLNRQNNKQEKNKTAGEKSPANNILNANPLAHNTTFFSLTQIHMIK